MARDFSGTNQNAQNNNGISGIDVNTTTMACRVNVDTQPGSESIMMTGSAISAGNSAGSIFTVAPGVSGWRVRFSYRWTTAFEEREYATDLSLGQWYNIVVTYDRGATGNLSRMWIDGSEVTLTTVTGAAGTAKTGVDSIIFGEFVGGGGDFDGKAGEAAIWDRILDDEEAVYQSKIFTPDHTLRGLKAYWPLVRGLTERMQGADLTNNGSTVSVHPRVIKPFHARIWTPPAAVGANAPTGVFYGPLVGSLGGPI